MPKAPDELAYLIPWYLDLRSRNPRGMRFEPVSFEAIESFGRLFDLSLEPWEVDTLSRLDGEWMASVPEPPS